MGSGGKVFSMKGGGGGFTTGVEGVTVGVDDWLVFEVV